MLVNRGILCCVLTMLLLGNLAIIALSVLHALAVFKIVRLSDKSADFAEQLSSDWTVKPFTKLMLTNDVCPDGWEVVFSVLWPGTVDGCIIGNNESVWTKSSYDNAQFKVPKSQRVGCNLIEKTEAVVQSKFDGKQICGLRGGNSYAEVNRVNLKTEKCPGETVPCSKKTSANNTICVENNMVDAICPVIDIVFVKDPSTLDRKEWIVFDT